MSEVAVAWRFRSLASLGTYLNGFAFKPQHWGEFGLPIVRIRELLDPNVEPDRYDGPVAQSFRIDDGDLIFSWSATLSVLFWNRGPAYLNQHLFKVTAARDVDVHFLYHVINFHLDRLSAKSHGTTMKHVTRGDLKGYLIELPDLPEQRRIVETLDTMDEQIDVASRSIDKLNQVRTGMLTRFVEEISLGTTSPLSDLCTADICYGIVQSGSYVSGGVPVLAIRDLAGDFETGLHRTSPFIDRRYRRSRVAPGDVLLSIKGTIGRVGVAPDYYEGNISREIARLRFSAAVDPHFAYQYLVSQQAQRRLDLAVVGTTRAEVSIHVLKRFEIPVPDMAVQRWIIGGMKKCDSEIASEEAVLEKLQSVRLGLARDLLTGRVRVPEETAS